MIAVVNTTDTVAGAFYNEWQGTDGQLRPHHARLYESNAAMGLDTFAPRWSGAQQRVDIDAVTFCLDPGNSGLFPATFSHA